MTSPETRFPPPLLAVLRRLGVYLRFLALLRRDRGRRTRQRVDTTARLRECDDITNGIHARQQRVDPIPTERDAAVRRCAKHEGFQQESELLLGFGLVQTHHREHLLLKIAAVDTNRATADLVAVAHHV